MTKKTSTKLKLKKQSKAKLQEDQLEEVRGGAKGGGPMFVSLRITAPQTAIC